MLLTDEQVDWLQNGLLEGELRGWTAADNADNQINYGQANALKKQDTKWPNNRVYYSFANRGLVKLSKSRQRKVRRVLNGLQKKCY